jgi:hypothetical protein
MDKGKQRSYASWMCVTAQHFKGEILFHIRKYKQEENGEKDQTKKGATIPIHRLKIFIDTFKETDDAIKRFKGDKEFNFRIDFGAN